MNALLLPFPGNEQLARSLLTQFPAELGTMQLRSFPDGESYIRLPNRVEGRSVILLCTLDRPDCKFLPLAFAAQAAKDQGAGEVILLAPYLCYLRQDKVFHPGEGLTSRYFARLMSGVVDRVITVDPHLHRIHHLEEIYSIPTTVVHAAPAIARWIQQHVDRPLLVGPDEESQQWVEAVATGAGSPFLILEKTRQGDWDVEVSRPQLAAYADRTPVLVDDIISTARTMIRTVEHLLEAGTPAPFCVGVHAIFAENSYEDLRTSGAGKIVSCNTINHPSNQIDLSHLLKSALV